MKCQALQTTLDWSIALLVCIDGKTGFVETTVPEPRKAKTCQSELRVEALITNLSLVGRL